MFITEEQNSNINYLINQYNQYNNENNKDNNNLEFEIRII